MAYATRMDVEAIYSSELIERLAWDKALDAVDTARLDRACDEASAEIDGYLSARMTLPLPSVPPVLRQIAVDIAVYTVALTADRLTEEIKDRYAKRVEFLKLVAQGKAGVGLPSTPDEPAPATPNAARILRAERF